MCPRLCLCLFALFVFPSFADSGEAGWQRLSLDERFRSEGVAAADVNRDGRLDVLAGDVWYEAPKWTVHEIREPGDFVAGKGYSDSFCNWTWDLNDDGWDDLIYISFPGKEFYWYENPQNKPGHWKEHLIWHSVCNETPQFADLTGDGQPEIVLGSQPEAQLGYLEIPADEAVYRKWSFRPISKPGDPKLNGTFKYYHGLGVGDMNGDGRPDVLIPHGWHEAPADVSAGPWDFHPLTLNNHEGERQVRAAHVQLYDMDLDGDQDIIMSSPHSYGIWWWENAGDDATFHNHLIDKSYSQTHALHLVDVNDDGTKDLLTGKRFYAHNGRDPGGKEPVVMYWYEIRRTKGKPATITPHEIVAGRNTGIGTQFTSLDFNGDGSLDVVLSNKKGVNVLLQRR